MLDNCVQTSEPTLNRALLLVVSAFARLNFVNHIRWIQHFGQKTLNSILINKVLNYVKNRNIIGLLRFILHLYLQIVNNSTLKNVNLICQVIGVITKTNRKFLVVFVIVYFNKIGRKSNFYVFLFLHSIFQSSVIYLLNRSQ